jgi:hypothetical protein
MIVFNRNLHFENEPGLEVGRSKSGLESIPVIRKASLRLSERFRPQSDWLDMSGQKARYWSGLPFQKADRHFSWALEIRGVLSLLWDAAERTIYYREEEGCTPERLRFWVLHTFLPLVLELERSCRILHVGSVEVEGKPVLFSAFSYGGKSTLTDYFLQRGHTLLSDDSLGIEEREGSCYAIPSYPFHRPFRQLETLGHYAENFSTEPKPLHAVFLLEKSGPGAAVTLTELRGVEKFKAFHYSAYIDFDFMKEERFVFFMEMAKRIPVYRVAVPWDKERLREVYGAITACCRK